MAPLTILLLFSSLAVLVLGVQLWRLTSSRSLMVNAVLGSASLLLAAGQVAAHRRMEWAVLLPFFTTMLFAGRAMGTWWRSRNEADLRVPAQLMTAAAALSLAATISACVVL